MRISTRSRYGLKLMINLASRTSRGYFLLKDIAKDEEISEKYLSLLVIPLRKAGLLTTSRGVNGGYSLSKNPSKISVKEIVEILEGDLAVVDSINNEDISSRSKNYASRYVWEGLGDKISGFLSTINLEDLAKIKRENNLMSIEYNI